MVIGEVSGGQKKKANVVPVFKKAEKGSRELQTKQYNLSLLEDFCLLEAISELMKCKKVIRNRQHEFAKGELSLINLIG